MNLKSILFPLSILFCAQWVWSNTPSSSLPPLGLNPAQVPQFIFIGSDDNYGQGMNPLMDLMAEFSNPVGNSIAGTYDGTPALMSFYSNSSYRNQSFIQAHHRMLEEGHEFGIHTHTHDTLDTYETSYQEIDNFYSSIAQPEYFWTSEGPDSLDGFGPEVFTGFRAPFLYVEDSVFLALQQFGIEYDCSIQDGWGPEYDGTNFSWPYTLDNGASEGWKFLFNEGYYEDLLRSYPDLWEIPIHPFVIPVDSYSMIELGYSLRDKVQASDFLSPIEVNNKIIGLDWDVLFEAHLDSAEVLAILKYNFDLRVDNNRAPINLGIHSPYYQLDTQGERNRGWLREFLEYALEHPATRIVTGQQVVDWMKSPVDLEGNEPVMSLANQSQMADQHFGVEGRYFWTGTRGTLVSPRGQKIKFVNASADQVQFIRLVPGRWIWQDNLGQASPIIIR